MDAFANAASPQVTEKVDNFLQQFGLSAGGVRAQVLLETDVYVSWDGSLHRHALHSRVIPFDTNSEASEAVRLLTQPASRLG